MHVLHVTAHLGGGVGKAHAALRAAMPEGIRQTYLLLEEPRDRRYADEIASHCGEIAFARDFADVAERCAAADIVQFEFWNHPKLFECLARVDFPPMRSVFWSHISGLFAPVIAPAFFGAVDRFVFTTPASMVLVQGLQQTGQSKFSSIGSGFGFPDLSIVRATHTSRGESSLGAGIISQRSLERSESRHQLKQHVSSGSFSLPEGEMPGRAEGVISPTMLNPIAYLGTVDFIKMHPGFFDAIDALKHDATAAIWGGYEPNGDVAQKARSMRHPERIRFMGQTSDPHSALTHSRIFFYPLQPDHYGTAENALIEAMSLGLVPVVLANAAECAIVENGVTGLIGNSIEECAELIDVLLSSPEKTDEIGRNAAAKVAETFMPDRSARAFATFWDGLLAEEKRLPDFSSIVGLTPLDWFLSTQYRPGENCNPAADTGKLSKGTLSHFRSAFPDDPCWQRPEINA